MSDTEIIDTPEAASAADADAMLAGFGLSSDRTAASGSSSGP